MRRRLAGVLVPGLLFALALAGCRETLAPGETVGSGGGVISEAVKYLHDAKRGVGCWYYVSANNTSISCLPDSQYRAPVEQP